MPLLVTKRITEWVTEHKCDVNHVLAVSITRSQATSTSVKDFGHVGKSSPTPSSDYQRKKFILEDWHEILH